MLAYIVIVLFLSVFVQIISVDVPSLPHCPDINGTGFVIVSTLDGKLSALNFSGSLLWQVDTGPGPLLLSNIHKLELTNNGEWIRLIPSLTGILYKFDGSTIDPIPISAEQLLKSSFRYSDDLVIAGGIEVRTYGIGFRTGTSYYECTSLKCSNSVDQDVDDILLIERSTHTIRAVDPRSGSERWNFSVGLHNIKLHRISCIEETVRLFNWNVSAVLPEGKLKVVITHNTGEHAWHYTFSSPIVRVWKWTGKNLSEVNLFLPTNAPSVATESMILPSIYIGMHKKQLYIHESLPLQEILSAKSNTNLTVGEITSIAKIPWRPIPASTQITDDDSTALSVLNASEYVNGHGFYLYTENDLKKDCSYDSNKSCIDKLLNKDFQESPFLFLALVWWKQYLIMSFSIIIGYVIYNFWQQICKRPEILVIEKLPERQIPPSKQLFSTEPFTSRYLNDFDTIRCLGTGGFGVVFEVKKKIDECHYAIKRIHLPDDKKSRDRVMREVKALAKLEHQNIVRYFNSWVEHPPIGWQEEHDKNWINDSAIYFDETSNTANPRTKRSSSLSAKTTQNSDGNDSFIEFKGSGDASVLDSNKNNDSTMSEYSKKKIDWKRPNRKHHSLVITPAFCKRPEFLYIQMQLCKKESLSEWLCSQKERNYNVVLDIFSQILDAVQYIHLSGLIHRDLKPSNIMFSLDGQIKVGDFGLVKDMEDALDLELLRKSASPFYRGHTRDVGTQLYMSPEQSKSRIYDYKIDIYSLGLIFIELLVYFNTEMERIKTLQSAKEQIYPDCFLSQYKNEHALLQSMLCKDPNKRLTTIGIKARPPFHQDCGYGEEYHYRLNNFQKN